MIRSDNFINTKEILFSDLHCASLPNLAKISLCQDGINIAKPIVRQFQKIEEGQLLAINELTKETIHSSVPGTVLGFEYSAMPNGKQEHSIVIEMSGEFSYSGKKTEETNWTIFSPTSRIEKISENGILNTFDNPVSLSSQMINARKSGITTLGIRLFDDDPSYITDGFIAKRYNTEVLEGTRIIASSINAKNVVFFYPEKNSLTQFNKNIIDLYQSINVEFIPIRTEYYPCGTKKNLLKILSKKLPNLDFSDFFIDATTAYNVYKSLVFRTPSIESIIHISGDAIREPKCIRVKIGTQLKNIIVECGGLIEEPEKVIINGLLKGISITDFSTPITKYVKAIRLVSKRGFPNQTVNDCIRCGRCQSICPEKLQPQNIISGNFLNTVFQCSECILCNTVCPSRIPLFQKIKLIKEKLKNEK